MEQARNRQILVQVASFAKHVRLAVSDQTSFNPRDDLINSLNGNSILSGKLTVITAVEFPVDLKVLAINLEYEILRDVGDLPTPVLGNGLGDLNADQISITLGKGSLRNKEMRDLAG